MKSYILIACVIGVLVSCQEDVDLNRPNPDLNLENAPERLEQMYMDGLDLAIQSLDQTLIDGGGKGVFLDNQSVHSKTFYHLENKYVYLNDLNVDAFFSDKVKYGNLENVSFDPGSSEFQEVLEIAYSGAQLLILKEFLDELFVTDDYGKVKLFARNFQNTVKGANLSHEEKFELLSLGAGIYALADFLDKGGMELVGEKIAFLSKESDTAPNLRCRVDMRAVWGSAVISGGYGAVRGGIIGCAGGTVLFPGLGTATGCVGGAVLGGATGFIEGAALGIAGSLLYTCWRS
jgi:hypothetical protein